MKLTEALNVKNIVAGQVAEVQKRIVESNHRQSTEDQKFNVQEQWDLLMTLIDKLATVKSIIECANAGVILADVAQTQWFRISVISELKGVITNVLMPLNTQSGTTISGGFQGNTSITYVVQWNAQKRAELIDSLTKQISRLQAEVNSYNAVTEVGLDGVEL